MKKIICLFFAIVLCLFTANVQAKENANKNKPDDNIDSIVKENTLKYERTKNKKYLNIAYKWALEAVDNKTHDIDTIKTAIVLSSYKLKPKNMMKSYELLCEVNEQECIKFNEKYIKSLDETNKLLKEKNEKNKENWQMALYGFLGGAAAGYQTGRTYNQPPPVNRHTSTSCRTIGSTIYCDTY